jgi:hypothetical protein
MKQFFDFKNLMILVLVLLNAYALYSLTKTKHQLGNETFLKKETFGQLQYCRDQLKRQKQNVDFYLKINTKPLPFIDSLSLAVNKPVLVLRVHSGDCNNCVKESLHILTEKEVLKHFRIVVFADFPTLKSVQETFLFDYPVYIVPQIGTDKIIENHKPYYFIVNKNKMYHFFVPEWDAMDLFRTYIEQLNNVYQ